ncbi:probable N-acetyltransferase CML5 [Periophthalmus magnuspinnatus]|uniref:probable N-acetyltransferase CML5 n=1 Tax=Periophthalmus magnuspinnatus TaxID=409849 RepID=UPI00145AE6AE|nr:probable N-acetyltransferase CML5 [Periophthalmus magnuspinnatus]
MKLVIREFRPSDEASVCDLFSLGIKEHIGPCFYNAMSSRLHLTITSTLFAAGYCLGSWLGAVLLPGLWVSVVFYCCHEIYAGYVRNRLQTDMRDIPGSFMSRPGDCFWVAEAEVEGRAQILGTVAVVEKEDGGQRFGELFRMIIAPSCRRMGLGRRLTQTVVDFCKDRGFSKVVLETSSTQAAAVALYETVGFSLVTTKRRAEAPLFLPLMARVSVLRMEKHVELHL